MSSFVARSFLYQKLYISDSIFYVLGDIFRFISQCTVHQRHFQAFLKICLDYLSLSPRTKIDAYAPLLTRSPKQLVNETV